MGKRRGTSGSGARARDEGNEMKAGGQGERSGGVIVIVVVAWPPLLSSLRERGLCTHETGGVVAVRGRGLGGWRGFAGFLVDTRSLLIAEGMWGMYPHLTLVVILSAIMLVSQTLGILAAYPSLVGLEWHDILEFIHLGTQIKQQISSGAPQATCPPALPLSCHRFLQQALGKDTHLIDHLWAIFGPILWDEAIQLEQTDTVENRRHEIDYNDLRKDKDIELFQAHGIHEGIEVGYREFYPPKNMCIHPACSRTVSVPAPLLSWKPLWYEATLFTFGAGPVKIWSNSVACGACHSRYSHNYYVHSKGTQRRYYDSFVPEIIEVAKHFYVETKLLAQFGAYMSLAVQVESREPYMVLGYEHVMDGFLIHSLLQDSYERSSYLEVQEDAESQILRLRPALEARNKCMVGIGQEMWNHICDVCTKITEEDGVQKKMQAVVLDGVAVGHYTCAVKDCKVPLSNIHHRFCQLHFDQSSLCCVAGCKAPMASGFMTCPLPEHRQLEAEKEAEAKSLFHRKHQDSLVVPSADGGADMEFLEDVNESEDERDSHRNLPSGLQPELAPQPPQAKGKQKKGPKVKTVFTRRSTHNEQLVVRPCGVVVGRATMYYSEAYSNVKDMLKVIFPTLESSPEAAMFDSACKVVAHIIAQGDPWFAEHGTAWVVDVFHFQKHKESDQCCREYCDPGKYSELVSADGKWVFNSSVAEQTNSWFEGFHAMCRAMLVDRWMVDELEKKGYHPMCMDLGALGISGDPITRELREQFTPLSVPS
ncbi:hypothetical protein BOTBODRAFT_48668 [Botryobasidium botryosum FD-172 SS1]|uniref:CxC6 like cysteine cluster associated with KDZ domain-containing protein n=1 Tax=Botryobasidium botryosum (strain FD-172 SS1) TaxID=930990 RepID=A0A067M7U3_BOTB1|nr:hypothetical protein BOTBODRAFT_48668 [Botryobasidium botryosum FD-172 SS1]